METAAVSQYTAEYQTISAALPGQGVAWLQRLRSEALAKFSGNGFPSLRDEEWRYTNVSGIEKKLFVPASASTAGGVDADWLAAYRVQDAWTAVLVDGHFVADLSALDGLPETVSIKSLAKVLEEEPDSAQPFLSQAVSNDEHGFVAFNTAWFTDGVLVTIPAKQVLAKPIQILQVVTEPDRLASTRNIIVANDMAQGQIIETFVGTAENYLTASVAEVFVGRNAELSLYKLQCESEKAYHFGGNYVKQARDARFSHHNFAFGGLLARTDIHSDLDDASECYLNGLFLGVKRQHMDNHTRINHLKPHGTSRELYKGILDERARGVFQGRVVVAEDAMQTDSEMNNRNLLLSDDAEADTKPQLEIYADDVKCAHGVTVGQLDEKSVFYLQSRCVDQETARNMLTFAFANEMVDKIPMRSLHDLVLEQLLMRFPQDGVNKDWL